jgi:hypothetical protein
MAMPCDLKRKGEIMKPYILMLLLPLLGACAGPSSYADKEDFQTDARHRREFAAGVAPLCAAARRALLGDGYFLDAGTSDNLVGTKKFQIEEMRHAMLRIYVSCSPRADAATLFVTATEEHFDVKTSRQSTSIGVPLLTPFSVSGKSESDTQVKTMGATVTARDFYERFYRAVQRELGR